MQDDPKKPILLQRHRASKTLNPNEQTKALREKLKAEAEGQAPNQTEPYKTLKVKLKAKARDAYNAQKAEAEREYKALIAELQAEAEREYQRGRLILIEQKCAELDILERFRFVLGRARGEEDGKKLNRRLTRIEKAINAIEEEARKRQQFPHNLARFFEALGEVSIMSRNRTRTVERESYTRTEYVNHYPWEEGSNEWDVETIRFDYDGDGPEWVEEEYKEWAKKHPHLV